MNVRCTCKMYMWIIWIEQTSLSGDIWIKLPEDEMREIGNKWNCTLIFKYCYKLTIASQLIKPVYELKWTVDYKNLTKDPAH